MFLTIVVFQWGSDSPSTNPLYMAVVETTYFQNVYKKGDEVWTGMAFKSPDEANKATGCSISVNPNYLKTITFTVEE